MSDTEQREEAVFEAALQLPADQRTAYLDQTCAGDADLRRRVEVLLGAFERAGGFMKQSATPERTVRISLPPTEKPGDKIGRYKLLEQIGEGGCGVVYVAEQEEPVRRRVALKVIKLGMDTKQVIARFDAERQALAMMDHPNIAKIFDAGITDAPLPASGHPLPVGRGEGSASLATGHSSLVTSAGRPYFVMELVRGIKITDYCDQNHLSPRERLDLFIQVCRAIQHAHQKGVIHRDIKPSNILVTLHDGVPVPKVIDFGIAKATQGRLTDQTVYTAFEQFIGTPAYMSPEQAELSGLDIDTRSDIYSLGVLLYELLTGKTPFDAKELLAAGLDEMRRTIREVEPVKPSTRLTQELAATAKRSADFQSAVSPISNRQAHESSDAGGNVKGSQAGSPAIQQIGNLRYKELIHALRGDVDWIVMKCLEKNRQRRYETANGLAMDIQRHLDNEPVVACPPSNLYKLQKLVRRNKLTFAAGAGIAAALVIGLAIALWQSVEKTRAYNRAVAAEQKAKQEAAKSRQVAQFLEDMLEGVGPSVSLGRNTDLLKEILDKTAKRVDNDLHDQPDVEAELLATLGNVYTELGDYTNASALLQKALTIRTELYGDEHPDVASSLNDLAEVLRWQGRVEAEAMHRDALAMRRRLLPSDHLDLAQSLSNLGVTLETHGGRGEGAQARYAEAETLQREALAIQRKALGNESIEVARSLNWLSLVLPNRNKSAEAEMLAKEGLDIYRKLYGDDHPALGHLSDALGLALRSQGKYAEAEAAFRQGMTARQKFLGAEHPDLRYSFVHLGTLFLNQRRLPEAEAMFRRLLACREKDLVYGEGIAAGAFSGLATVLRDQGRWDEAKSVLREAEERGHVQALNDLAWVLATSPDVEIRDLPDALVYAEKAVAATGRTNAPYLDTLAATYAAAGQFTNAMREQREAIALLRTEEEKRDYASRLRLYESNTPYRDDGELATRASALLAEGKFAEAEPLARECLSLRAIQIPDEWRTFNAKSMLGVALLGQKKYAEAEPYLLSGYEGMKQREATIPAASKVRLKEALERLVQLYEATGKPDQAAEWKQKLAEFDQTAK